MFKSLSKVATGIDFENIAEVDMPPLDNKRWKLTMMGNTYDQFQQSLSFGYQPQYVRNSLQVNNGLTSSPKKIANPLPFSKSLTLSPKGEDQGEVTFSEIGQLAGVSATEWSWAPLFADFDNDGLKDLFVSDGYRQDITNLDFITYGKRTFMGTPAANRKDRIDMLKKFEGIKVADYLFKNNGDLTFKNVAPDWGLDDATFSNGAANGDLDNDGDLDLVVDNIDQPASVYENQLKINLSQNWLRINFNGPAGNRDGPGAKVYAWQGAQMQYQYYSPCRGYLSCVEPFVHFGFQNKTVDSLKVIWPDGKEQLIKNPLVNTLLTLSYNNAKLYVKSESKQSEALFSECSQNLKVYYKHQEDEFVDFKIQPLLPRLLSHEGPAISVADVNADNLEDFFAGGAAGSKGQIFIQKKNATFSQHSLADGNLPDNMGALFFDTNNDGKQVLYIVSGGVCDKQNGDSVYQHKFYLNDGKGNFTADRKNINVIGDNKAVAELTLANGSTTFLISSNSDSLHVFRLNQSKQKSIAINSDETFAIVTNRNGTKSRHEFYYGNSYLSQSGRWLTISPNIKSVALYTSQGKKRELNF